MYVCIVILPADPALRRMESPLADLRSHQADGRCPWGNPDDLVGIGSSDEIEPVPSYHVAKGRLAAQLYVPASEYERQKTNRMVVAVGLGIRVVKPMNTDREPRSLDKMQASDVLRPDIRPAPEAPARPALILAAPKNSPEHRRLSNAGGLR